MQTDSWGSHAWETFNHVAFGSPETLDNEDKINYKKFPISFTQYVSLLACTLWLRLIYSQCL